MTKSIETVERFSDLMKIKRVNWLLLLILAIAVFFRFYKFLDFQYFSGDEEILVATIRHIIWDKSPTLLVANSALGFGLGPFFHFLLAPFFALSNFNLTALPALASLLGVATTYLVFLSGKELGGKRTGYLASFLYAASFFISLVDRRLWPLTPDSFLAALTFWLLAKTLKGNFKFSPFLAIPIGFAFHADPSLLVLAVAIMIVLALYVRTFNLKRVLISFSILGFFALPFLAADLRYEGAFHRSLIKTITKPLRGEKIETVRHKYFDPSSSVAVFAKTLFTRPDNFIERNFCYCLTPEPLLSKVGYALVIAGFVISFLGALVERSGEQKRIRLLPFIMMASFFLGILIFNLIFKGVIFDHYFAAIIPIFILIMASAFSLIYQKNKFVVWAFLFFYLIVNLYTLLNSEVKYPTYQKLALVQRSLDLIGVNQFALYASSDPYVQGGGWNELYAISGYPPARSYWYDFWDWIYQAYSLFPGPIQDNDPQTIVFIGKVDEPLDKNLELVGEYIYKDLRLTVSTKNQ